MILVRCGIVYTQEFISPAKELLIYTNRVFAQDGPVYTHMGIALISWFVYM